ncbi:MAG: hypothetical protein A3H98_11340 [Bacteroidetes bacterium RIFCSPLOWO2_02_FULL_36_8]|nr:MAG: hypothetical protein A3H98_11340 [Bacteroidetes bacterium RIFCSPLOWO2_02_FULL_36_8]OFY69106.1 MAG: hypothetical protein A3G23_06030 [Bacteroidetes bacterium RIFCSPLOWO2_12_FULL_37_12]
MKVLLDIKDDKASSLMEVLRGLSFVKTEMLSEEKVLLIKEIKEAVEEMKLIRAGKLKARPVKELLDEI